MESSNMPAIVMDSGTGYMKIGYAGENFPRTVFPAMIGRPMLRFEEKIDDIELKVYNHNFILINYFIRI